MRVSWLRASLRTRLVVLGLMVNLTLAGMLTAVALLSWQSLLQQDLHARGDAISGLLALSPDTADLRPDYDVGFFQFKAGQMPKPLDQCVDLGAQSPA